MLFSATSTQAAPAAGSSLDNRATGSYISTVTGLLNPLVSNRIIVRVAPLEALLLTIDTTRAAAASGSFAIAHRIQNTGNTQSTYSLVLANLGGDDFQALGLDIISDLNGNGVLDPGESPISGGPATLLAPLAILNLLVVGSTPGTVLPGQIAQILLTATTDLQGASDSNTDDLVIGGGAILSLSKAASDLTPSPGGAVTFTLSGRNTGPLPATGSPVTVDGAAASYVLLRDALPPNLEYTSPINPSFGIALYHSRGSPTLNYTTLPPADLTQVDEIAFGLPDLASGQAYSVSFDVRVLSLASGPITNTGEIRFDDGISAGIASTISNSVTLIVSGPGPSVDFFTDTSYGSVAALGSVGSPLYLQAESSQCNLNPSLNDPAVITLTSSVSGDSENFVGIEISPNSGVFRVLPSVPTADAGAVPVLSGNGVLEIAANDVITAALAPCGTAPTAYATLLIDPLGIVFDSQTNLPLGGAVVTLMNSGLPAVVLEADGSTPAANPVVTGPDGRYQFPLVAPGTYSLQVVAPAGYGFPSTVPIGLLPPGRAIDPSGSFGLPFGISALGPVLVDIPLDPGALVSGLSVEKAASRDVVEIGDLLDYEITVRNGTGAALFGVEVLDTLPVGFQYEQGSARLDFGPMSDPVASGRSLVFDAGVVISGQTLTISYRVNIGPGTELGEAINRATATSTTTTGNTASAIVDVQGGVFHSRGFILGKVYTDCNDNGLQDPGEIGLAQVRLYLENGSFVFTDADGKYSFYGVEPRTHVVKIDRYSLPAGSSLSVLSNRNGEDPDTRFVDLKRGELHRADFAENSCSNQILAEALARRERTGAAVSELEKQLDERLAIDRAPTQTSDPRTLPAEGTQTGRDSLGLSELSRLLGLSQPEPKPVAPINSKPAFEQPGFDVLLPELDNELDFLWPMHGQRLLLSQTIVRVKGPIGTRLALHVNGNEVSDSRVGTRSSLRATKTEAWEYVAVRLEPGSNYLELVGFDAFGNQRGSKNIEVFSPGALAKVELSMPMKRVPADGTSGPVVEVRLLDATGLRVGSRTAVTLESTRGTWEVEDVDPVEPGVQSFINGGIGRFAMTPATETGEVEIRARSGRYEAQTELIFVPALRPLVAVGVVEGSFAQRGLESRSSDQLGFDDGFEEELSAIGGRERDWKNQFSSRTAVFLKGAVDEEYLLTFRYDSAQKQDSRLFRDIQPDEFYPVYGDASLRGFDAQSTTPLYMRIEKDRSHITYGDFTTNALESDPRSLARYQRSLTGVFGRYEHDVVDVDFFASEGDATQVSDEIPAEGISGPYTLSVRRILRGSETVEVITRDRDHPSVVIKAEPQARFTDYTVDSLSGTILFSGPVASHDSDLNPRFIRASYEVEEGGSDHWITGARARYRPFSFLEFGGSFVEDQNDQEPFSMASAGFTLKLSDETKLVGEAAATDTDLLGGGIGERLELRHAGSRLDAHAYAGKTDEQFSNTGSGLGTGRLEIGLDTSFQINQKTRLRGEYLRTEDVATDGRRQGVAISVERTLGASLKAELGARYVTETLEAADSSTEGDTPRTLTSLRAKLTAQLPQIPKLSVFAEFEQDVDDFGNRMLGLGGEYQINPRARVYARHELISSLVGPFALNSHSRQHATVVGLDADYTSNSHVFSEYRGADTFSGRDAEAAIGLRGLWKVTPLLGIQSSLERIHSLSRTGDQESTAIAIGLGYTANKNWKATGRLEFRDGRDTESWLHTAGLAARISDSWTGLIRHSFTLDSADDSQLRDRIQIGLAFRDTATNFWDGLFQLEFRAERAGRGSDPDVNRDLAIFSTHLNVQPSRRLNLFGRYAAKFVVEDSNTLDDQNLGQLISSRLTYDITGRWDLSLMGSVLTSNGTASYKYGLGAEVGYLVMQNLWLSGGYNVFGFEDDDLDELHYSTPGVYVRLRFKFDEKLLTRETGPLSKLLRFR
ncbi:MAG: DUF11 domain-containing protein [bacterium]|nr:DUF11 domain-containing protein [bacterium]